jgi:hypothetical protein
MTIQHFDEVHFQELKLTSSTLFEGRYSDASCAKFSRI